MIKKKLFPVTAFLFVLSILFYSFTAFAGNWWDKFGQPQYGGEIKFAINNIIANFDNYNFIGAETNYWYESLFEPDWTLDHNVWDTSLQFIPDKYWRGLIAESWKITDPKTITVKIRRGVRWQNKAPVNGREFTAYDVQAHYDRILGTGSGFTTKAPMFTGMTGSWERVSAVDKYTVVFKFKTPSAGTAFQSIADRWALNEFEAPEWAAQGNPPVSPSPAPGGGGPPPPPPPASGPLGDWKTVVGTGAWMLTDFVPNSSMRFSKNPDHWGTDPRYPQNKTPYADKLTIIVIPDLSTQLAALRTGKIDVMNDLDWKQAKYLEKSNPELVKELSGPGLGNGIIFKNQVKPFNDIRIRQAMQMAIDRKTMALSLYGGSSNGKPCGMVTQTYKGYCYSYEDWPQSLKDQYTYNPELSKKLLAKAGYPKGFKTNVVVQTGQSGGTSGEATLELIQVFKSMFKDIGIDMQVRAMDRTQFETFTRAGKHDQMSSFNAGLFFPPTRIIDSYYSKSPEIGQSGTIDAVYDKARNKFWTANTEAKAAAALVECDKRVIEQHWGVWMEEGSKYSFNQPYFKGFSHQTVIFWGGGVVSSRFWIDQSLKK